MAMFLSGNVSGWHVMGIVADDLGKWENVAGLKKG